jgi:hypothetical protein
VNTQSFSAFLELAQNKNWLKKSAAPSNGQTAGQKNLLTPHGAADLLAAQERIQIFKRRIPQRKELYASFGVSP